jgi:hypothetical protein
MLRWRVIPVLWTLAVAAIACRKQQPPPPAEDTGVGDTGPVWRVPEETADDDALGELVSWTSLPILRPDRRYRQQTSNDRGKGGDGGIRLLGNGNRDLNNFVCSGDGADGGKPLVPFAFDLDRCPEAYVKGFVLSRFEGSGRMTRLWMTAFSWRGGSPGDQVLRIYVDDDPTPLLEVPAAKVLDGTAGELFAPPFGAGTGRFLAWHYPVVFAKKLIVTIDVLGVLDNFYHQTDVVLDATPIARKASATRLARRDDAKKLLTRTDPFSTAPLLPEAKLTLEPAKPTVVADLTGPATIHSLELWLADVPSDQIDVSIVWDDAATPAIAATLAELFAETLSPHAGGMVWNGGTGAVDAPYRSLALQLPMPFGKHAQISLTNRATSSARVIVKRLAGEKAVPSGTFGRLFVETHDTKGPTTLAYHPLASVTGAGRYLGTCVAMQGHAMTVSPLTDDPLNFLEGDERGKIDGTLVMQGTGTEDYFDSAFYFGGSAGGEARPFAQWWGVASDPKAGGKASACRWHLLDDVIDFSTGLELALEIGPGDPSLLDRYRSVAFYYR